MIRTNSVERRKYRTEIPNIVDDLGLSVYAYRLYGHIRRVAGETGECFQSTPTLAKACGMSAGKISDAKKELAKPRSELGGLPLIRISKRDQPPGVLTRKGDSIRVTDIWAANHAAFSKRARGSVHEMNDNVHHMSEYVHGTGYYRSPPEIKKEQEERTHEEEGRAAARTPSRTTVGRWEVSPRLDEWVDENCPGVDRIAETENFFDYHRSKGTLSADWNSEYRIWMRRAAKWKQNKDETNGKSRTISKYTTASERHAEIMARRDPDKLLDRYT
jgi:hypothetical protein